MWVWIAAAGVGIGAFVASRFLKKGDGPKPTVEQATFTAQQEQRAAASGLIPTAPTPVSFEETRDFGEVESFEDPAVVAAQIERAQNEGFFDDPVENQALDILSAAVPSPFAPVGLAVQAAFPSGQQFDEAGANQGDFIDGQGFDEDDE